MESIAVNETARAGFATGEANVDGCNGRVAAPADAEPRSSAVSMKPDERKNIPSAATSTVGSFLGNAGVFDTMAEEMMRASGDTAPMMSRAAASRYFAR